MEKPARTPEPPYYAVIFSPVRSGEDPIGYQAMAQTMLELAATMPGYLGVEHGEGINGFAMTVSYWQRATSRRSGTRESGVVSRIRSTRCESGTGLWLQEAGLTCPRRRSAGLRRRLVGSATVVQKAGCPLVR